MKMTEAKFDDDEKLSEVTVTLPLDELAVLYRLTGHIAPKAITDASGDVRWGNAFYDLAYSAGDILNRFFEDGANSVIPRFKPIAIAAMSTIQTPRGT